MKKLLLMSLLMVSLTGCGCGSPFVECRIVTETEYVLPPDALLETHPRPTLPNTDNSKRNVKVFVELLKGSIKKYETDKLLLRSWKVEDRDQTSSSDSP